MRWMCVSQATLIAGNAQDGDGGCVLEEDGTRPGRAAIHPELQALIRGSRMRILWGEERREEERIAT